jgi:hypothetical protein
MNAAASRITGRALRVEQSADIRLICGKRRSMRSITNPEFRSEANTQ